MPIVPLIVVFLAAIAAAFSTLAAGLSAANDVMSARDSSAQPGPSVPQTSGAILPIPFPGETSEGFHVRYPEGVVCDIPLALKWDPWFVLSTPSGFKRGAWIPADASFTLPVG